MDIYQKLPGVLLPWYRDNRRDLPWRKDKDPYHIWISEIMLQQTRVEAVKGYYARFLDAIPNIAALAEADDELLHKLWEGLGYYSRVRNLKKAAQLVMADYCGVFPREHKQILSLPGIGPYTAGAIASIAFNQPVPAVDGNVLRIASRLTNDDTPIDLPACREKLIRSLAAVYPQEAGAFTQALMELGATICGPNRKPDCENCPCYDFCKGRILGTAESLPVKTPKKQRREENLTVFILNCDGKIALQKRPEQGLLAGLWQFPNVSGTLDAPEAIAYLQSAGLEPRDIKKQVERKHIFTHIQWNMRGIYMDVSCTSCDLTWMTPEQISRNAALPTAFRQFWEQAEDNVIANADSR